MNTSKINYGSLRFSDKFKIISKLSSFVTSLGDIYKYSTDTPEIHRYIQKTIQEEEEYLRQFFELLKYEGNLSDFSSIQDASKPYAPENSKTSISEGSKIADNIKEHQEIKKTLSDEEKEYITSLVNQLISEKIDIAIKHIDDYYQSFLITNKIQQKAQNKMPICKEIKAKEVRVSTESFAEKNAQHNEDKVQENLNVIKSLSSEHISSRKDFFATLSDDIKVQVIKSLDIFNQNHGTPILKVRKLLAASLDKPVIRLTLPSEIEKDFVNKTIADLKSEWNCDNVKLIRTDGTNNYIAQSVSDNIYMVFPERFAPYSENRAWEKGYPIFFDISPVEQTSANKYKLIHPAFFQKNGDKYQMIEGGKGRIELEK